MSTGYFFTGDGAYRSQEGYYQITGRLDDVINVSGHRIGTAEIEDVVVRSMNKFLALHSSTPLLLSTTPLFVIVFQWIVLFFVTLLCIFKLIIFVNEGNLSVSSKNKGLMMMKLLCLNNGWYIQKH